jgi:uncharacterized membrane protein
MRRNRELIAALLAVLAATAIYAYFYRGNAPRSGSPVGHWMGVIGMALMLATETLYSLRKRAKRVHFGRLRDWLSVHIFMGIFGPYLVLLHTAWTFRGLAGAAMLMTITVVISGFVGRYIYTRIPRASDGSELPSAAAAARRMMATWHTVHVPLGLAMFTAATLHALAGLYFSTLGR